MSKSESLEKIRLAVIKANPTDDRWNVVLADEEKVRLADVLLAIQKADKYYYVSTTGRFLEYYKTEYPLDMECHWNLLEDDVTKQSEETLLFLSELV